MTRFTGITLGQVGLGGSCVPALVPLSGYPSTVMSPSKLIISADAPKCRITVYVDVLFRH